MKKIIFIALVFFSVKVLSQPLPIGKPEENGISSERLTRIDKVMNDYVNKGYIPGAVSLIVRNGKIVYKRSFGYSDIEKKTPLKPDHIFRIASQSKAITALAIMMLWEEGKFLLDDPINKFIPEFKKPNVLITFNAKDSSFTSQPAKSEITFRQLLTHTSGIDYAAIGSQEMKAIYAKAKVPSGIGSNKDVLAEKMKILGGLPLKHNPGEQWTYSLSFDVLGYLVEVISGLPFDEFLHQRIFKPLGMNDTYFYLPKEKYNRLVPLYQNKEEHLSKINVIEKIDYTTIDANYPATNGKYFSGGAGLSSTVEDYAKFLQFFLNQGEFNGVRLLSRKTIELMLTSQLHAPISNQVGLGFGLETDQNDYQSVLSIGSFFWGGAFSTTYWVDPKEHLIGINYTNIVSNPHWEVNEKFKILVYQSIID
ncbi:MAG: serine hydrolase [Bacteroidetes bacterium]|nr:serine hydrolase [Bacteroidota bacterium]